MKEKEENKKELIALVEDISTSFKKDIDKFLEIFRAVNNTQMHLLMQISFDVEKKEGVCQFISSYVLAMGSFLSVTKHWVFMKEFQEKYQDKWTIIQDECKELEEQMCMEDS